MKILPLIVATLLLLSNCIDEKDIASKDSVDYFRQNIGGDMSYKVLLRTFGEPDKDFGSGIHIYVHTLADSTEVRIGYTDRVVYALQVDSSNQILEILL